MDEWLNAPQRWRGLTGGAVQVPGTAVKHSDIVATVSGGVVRAVRTEWPVGLPFVDAGATAFDARDGSLPVRPPLLMCERAFKSGGRAMAEGRAAAVLSPPACSCSTDKVLPPPPSESTVGAALCCN